MVVRLVLGRYHLVGLSPCEFCPRLGFGFYKFEDFNKSWADKFENFNKSWADESAFFVI